MQGIYKFAGVNFKISYNHYYTKKLFEQFLVGGEEFQEEITVTSSDTDYEVSLSPNVPVEYLENLAVCRKLIKILLNKYQAVLFHGSAIKYNGKAYLLTAPSGTGKSTHANNLKILLGDKLSYISDDKPFLRVENGVVYVYGSAWNGKHFLGENDRAPLSAICKINRSETNYIEPLSSALAIKTLLEQTVEYSTEETAQKLLSIVLTVAQTAKFYVINCNKELDSANVTFSGIMKE